MLENENQNKDNVNWKAPETKQEQPAQAQPEAKKPTIDLGKMKAARELKELKVEKTLLGFKNITICRSW